MARVKRKLPTQPHRAMSCAGFRQRLIKVAGDFVMHNHRLDNDSQKLTLRQWFYRLESYYFAQLAENPDDQGDSK